MLDTYDPAAHLELQQSALQQAKAILTLPHLREAVRQGTKDYMGEARTDVEFHGVDDFTASRPNDLTVFAEYRGTGYVLWGVVMNMPEIMRLSPDELASAQGLETTLQQAVHDAYTASTSY